MAQWWVRRISRGTIAAALIALLAGCSAANATAHKARDPFTVDKSVTPAVLRLEPDAVRRLDLRTQPVTESAVLRTTPGRGLSIPYGALLYKADGSTYVYQQTAENTFVSIVVTVDHIADQLVALSVGPPIGALVVTAGAAELAGIEFGVGK